jgi:hypothetical protein
MHSMPSIDKYDKVTKRNKLLYQKIKIELNSFISSNSTLSLQQNEKIIIKKQIFKPNMKNKVNSALAFFSNLFFFIASKFLNNNNIARRKEKKI